jgi:hypothetical protein
MMKATPNEGRFAAYLVRRGPLERTCACSWPLRPGATNGPAEGAVAVGALRASAAFPGFTLPTPADRGLAPRQ